MKFDESFRERETEAGSLAQLDSRLGLLELRSQPSATRCTSRPTMEYMGSSCIAPDPVGTRR
jgi:hypothetical protein